MKIHTTQIIILIQLFFFYSCNSENKISPPISQLSEVFDIKKMDLQYTDSSIVSGVDGESCTVDDVGNIYIGQFNAGKILVFYPTGLFKKSIARKGTGPGELQEVVSIDIDSTGKIFILGNLRITVFDTSGLYRSSFIYGDEACSVMRVYEQNFIIRYSGAKTNKLFEEMSGDGTILRSWGSIPKEGICNLGNRTDMTIDNEGNIYTMYYFEPKIYKYDRSGNLQNTFGETPNYFAKHDLERIKSAPEGMEKLKRRMEGTIVESIFFIAPDIIALELYGYDINKFKFLYRYLEIYNKKGDYFGSISIPDSINIAFAGHGSLYGYTKPKLMKNQVEANPTLIKLTPKIDKFKVFETALSR